LRLDARLHDLLRQDALKAGVSLNEWCGRMLAAPGAGGVAAAEVVLSIRSWLGDDLEGIVLHGSFARDDLSTTSDVDLLAVVRSGRPITRALYREWEKRALAWDGREVDLHFVHLPTADDRVSGSWAEAAVCGIVLYDRNLALSRRLIGIRERIAAGGLVRRMAQGQPYWIDEGFDAQS
jgi:predicted nucleotidyltransferase